MPDIPNDIMDRIDKLSESIPILSGFSKNLIKTLQTHPDKTKTLEGKQLESAALVGIEIMEELHKEFKEKSAITTRFKTLISALFSNPTLRTTLISRSIVPSKFINMNGQELMSKEAAERHNAMQEKEQAAGRSDAILEYKRKHAAKSVMFECIVCIQLACNHAV